MIQNYKMVIAYDGTRYHGWEHKKDVETIQGKIEAVLSRMTDTEIRINGAGRTDAGVHAQAMVANGRMDTELSCDEMRDYLNRYLPEDICVKEVSIAPERFHARFNAKGKEYRYVCYAGKLKPVFDRKYVWTLEKKPDVSLMRAAASYLVGEKDFKSFCGNKNMKKSTVRKVYSIDIEEKEDYIYLTFCGSGFLQNMVRIMTGTLVKVGLGEEKPEAMIRILAGRNRQLAGPTAPPQGLSLLHVEYENEC